MQTKKCNEKSHPLRGDFLSSLCWAYSSEIAPTGHPSSHAPQSMQAFASTTYFPSPSAIAPTGHVSAHAPQQMHSSLIILAIIRLL